MHCIQSNKLIYLNFQWISGIWLWNNWYFYEIIDILYEIIDIKILLRTCSRCLNDLLFKSLFNIILSMIKTHTGKQIFQLNFKFM